MRASPAPLPPPDLDPLHHARGEPTPRHLGGSNPFLRNSLSARWQGSTTELWARGVPAAPVSMGSKPLRSWAGQRRESSQPSSPAPPSRFIDRHVPSNLCPLVERPSPSLMSTRRAEP